jgi:hypothetical protein
MKQAGGLQFSQWQNLGANPDEPGKDRAWAVPPRGWSLWLPSGFYFFSSWENFNPLGRCGP